MSGNNSNGGAVLFSPRKPRYATAAMVTRIEIRKKPRSILVLVNDGYVLAAASFQKFSRFKLGEPRIPRFYCEEKAVVSRTAEPRPVEHWVIPAGQAIHELPGKEGRECG